MFRKSIGSILLAASLAGCSASSDSRLSERWQSKPAPNFALEDLNGKDVKLSDFRGKPVVLAFFAYG